MSVLRANLAITGPWNVSLMQTRKMKSPIAVTFGVVDEGLTILILFC